MSQDQNILLLLGLALGLAVLVLLFMLLRQNKAEQQRRGEQEARDSAKAIEDIQAKATEDARTRTRDETLENLKSQQSHLAGQLKVMGETQASAQTLTMKALQERLDTITGKVNVSLTESAQKTAKSLGEITNRLSVIDKAQKNITELSGQVVSLQHVLDNKQARGAFGELQMEDIFRNALPPSAYEFQATLSNGKRADGLIKLPNPPGPIVVDSKFPLESYSALRNAEDEAALTQATRDFRQAVKKHIKDISQRYIVVGETAESALMFLPSEAVYAELHANFVDLVEESYKARVWIVSPTTLMATLNTVRAILKDFAMREQAHVIQAEVGKMMGDVGRLQTRVSNLQKHFQQAEGDLKDINTSTTKILRSGEKIEDVQLEEPATDPLLPGETGASG